MVLQTRNKRRRCVQTSIHPCPLLPFDRCRFEYSVHRTQSPTAPRSASACDIGSGRFSAGGPSGSCRVCSAGWRRHSELQVQCDAGVYAGDSRACLHRVGLAEYCAEGDQHRRRPEVALNGDVMTRKLDSSHQATPHHIAHLDSRRKPIAIDARIYEYAYHNLTLTSESMLSLIQKRVVSFSCMLSWRTRV